MAQPLTTHADAELDQRITAYLAHRMPSAQDIVVDELARIHGGTSQETYRLRARWTQDGNQTDQRLVLRRAPVSGTVIVEDELEYTIYAALEGQGLPVPRVYYFEKDPSWLDRSFFIMEMCAGNAPAVTDANPYGDHTAKIGRQFWRYMGKLAAIDHRAVGLTGLRNGTASDDLWQRELDHWEAILDENERYVELSLRGAIRWMRANPPQPSAKPAIIHGDLRSGNFLFTDEGNITAILDWEMGHIGDPMEDVAWALNPLWSISNLIPEEEGLAIWEDASGLTINRADLDWWRLFAAIKASGIWTTAEASISSGKSITMAVAGSAMRGHQLHRAEVLSRMAKIKGLA